MGYRFIRDIHIEEPYYHTIARMLNGNKLGETFNGKTSYQVECPCCKKKKARMGYSKQKDTFIKMVDQGAFVEAIADKLDRSVNSVRGKALSLLRAGEIAAIPKQEHTKGAAKDDPLADLGDVSGMTVEAIADSIGKTARGVKTMLTRRGLTAADYDGAAKKEKAAS